MLVTQPGDDWVRNEQPIVVPRTRVATPVASPVDLPPFFGQHTMEDHPRASDVAAWMEQ